MDRSPQPEPAAGELHGRTVVVTAGPTREYLDPVRFISNPSTGRMGFALAEAARSMGAETILIAGPTHLEPPAGVRVMRVVSALDLREAVMSVFDGADVVISAAAVADYRPESFEKQKIKKSEGPLVMQLARNPDILAELGEKKGDKVLVGFAAETENLLENATGKLRRKNLDLIVANDVTQEGSGFGSETNTVTLIARGAEPVELPPLTKREVAERVMDEVARMLVARDGAG